MALRSLQDYLNDQTFIRVHRSYIVSIGKIDSVEQDEINISSYKIPISRKNKDAIMEQILKKQNRSASNSLDQPTILFSVREVAM